MKVIVHIGRPKTGTTSLQQFLYANRQALSDAGYLLFDHIGQPNNIDIAAYFCRTFPNGLKQWRWRRGVYDEAARQAFFRHYRVRDLVEQQVEHGRETHHTAIITSEHLASSLSRQKEIADFKKWLHDLFDSARVVAFFRPQVDLAASSWSTSVSGGYQRGLSTFLDGFMSRRGLDYLSFARRWSTVFEREEIAFHVYQSTRQWDVREFFAHHYLHQAEGLFFPTGRSNSAFGRRKMLLVRLVNRFVPFWLPGHNEPNPRNLALRRFISGWTAANDRPVTLTPGDRKRIARHFQNSNAEFSRLFLTNGETL